MPGTTMPPGTWLRLRCALIALAVWPFALCIGLFALCAALALLFFLSIGVEVLCLVAGIPVSPELSRSQDMDAAETRMVAGVCSCRVDHVWDSVVVPCAGRDKHLVLLRGTALRLQRGGGVQAGERGSGATPR